MVEMISLIHDKSADPLGAMMLDYFNGDHGAYVDVESPDLEMTTMAGSTMFREFGEMTGLEQHALECCSGSTLDVGAGSGCHTLHLQGLGMAVDALDISPGCIKVMKHRRVNNPLHKDVFFFNERKYSTILMLMNGLGICGTLDRLNLFLQLARTMLQDGGQILADSTDLRALLSEGESWAPSEGYFGETQFVMHYKDSISAPFEWLYVDYPTLQSLAEFNGFSCERLVEQRDGQYLVRMQPLQ